MRSPHTFKLPHAGTWLPDLPSTVLQQAFATFQFVACSRVSKVLYHPVRLHCHLPSIKAPRCTRGAEVTVVSSLLQGLVPMAQCAVPLAVPRLTVQPECQRGTRSPKPYQMVSEPSSILLLYSGPNSFQFYGPISLKELQDHTSQTYLSNTLATISAPTRPYRTVVEP